MKKKETSSPHPSLHHLLQSPLVLLRRLGLAPADLEGPVLALLDLLARLARGLLQPVADETVLGLELLGDVDRVVNQAKAGGFASAKLRAEAEDEDRVGLPGVVHLGELLADLGLGHVGAARVQHVDDELAPAEQAVGHELARAHGARLVRHVVVVVLSFLFRREPGE